MTDRYSTRKIAFITTVLTQPVEFISVKPLLRILPGKKISHVAILAVLEEEITTKNPSLECLRTYI